MSAGKKVTKRISEHAPHRCEHLMNPDVWPYAYRCKGTASHRVEFEGPNGDVGELELCMAHRRAAISDPTSKILGDKRINYR